MNPLVLIPARLASARLPGKPLADIAGRPMIAHVVALARAASIGPVLVATDSAEIAAAAEAAGGRAILTRDHVSGTDRVAEALAQADPARRHDIIVNLQGDEPELDPAFLRATLDAFHDAGVAIATLAAPLEAEEAASPHAVKVAGPTLARGLIAATTFFRAPPQVAQEVWRHIGVYAYRRAALERFVALPPSPSEQRERLEQLRALDAGMRIAARLVGRAPRGVDTPADLAAVRARFAGGQSR